MNPLEHYLEFRNLTASQFAKKHPFPFLLLLDAPKDARQGIGVFATQAVSSAAVRHIIEEAATLQRDGQRLTQEARRYLVFEVVNSLMRSKAATSEFVVGSLIT